MPCSSGPCVSTVSENKAGPDPPQGHVAQGLPARRGVPSLLRPSGPAALPDARTLLLGVRVRVRQALLAARVLLLLAAALLSLLLLGTKRPSGTKHPSGSAWPPGREPGGRARPRARRVHPEGGAWGGHRWHPPSWGSTAHLLPQQPHRALRESPPEGQVGTEGGRPPGQTDPGKHSGPTGGRPKPSPSAQGWGPHPAGCGAEPAGAGGRAAPHLLALVIICLLTVVLLQLCPLFEGLLLRAAQE